MYICGSIVRKELPIISETAGSIPLSQHFYLISVYTVHLCLVMTFSLTGREMKQRGRSDEQTREKGKRKDVKERKEKDTAISKTKKADKKKKREMPKKTESKKNERLVGF